MPQWGWVLPRLLAFHVHLKPEQPAQAILRNRFDVSRGLETATARLRVVAAALLSPYLRRQGITFLESRVDLL